MLSGLKLDGCGGFRNLSVWAALLNKTGRPVLLEDCHWGGDGPGMWGDGGAINSGPNAVPEAHWQPSNVFRTSGDIGGSWDSMFQNLQTVVRWQPWRTWKYGDDEYDAWFAANVRTGPGRWACEYTRSLAQLDFQGHGRSDRLFVFSDPDMSVVGNLRTEAENRAHWAAWCIVSSPLILGFDLNDVDKMVATWPIISNPMALSVSQTFARMEDAKLGGIPSPPFHPGGLVRSWSPTVDGTDGAPSGAVQYLLGTTGANRNFGWEQPPLNQSTHCENTRTAP